MTHNLFFDQSVKGKELFIAEEDGIAVGYITVNAFKKPGQGEEVWESTQGENFMTDLEAIVQEPNLPEAIRNTSGSVLAVTGVVTREDKRKQGVQTQLWQNVFAEMNPDIIVGHTKNPQAVMSRIKACGDGYRTFLGKVEVSSGVDTSAESEEDPSARALRVAALNHYSNDLGEPDRNDRLLAHRQGIISLPLDADTRAVPDVSGFPSNVQTGFTNLIEQQTKFPDKLLMMPLVSMRVGGTFLKESTVSSKENSGRSRERPPEA